VKKKKQPLFKLSSKEKKGGRLRIKDHSLCGGRKARKSKKTQYTRGGKIQLKKGTT